RRHSHAHRRGPHARLVAVLGCRALPARIDAAVLRQAVRARLPDRGRVEQGATGARAPARGRGRHLAALPRLLRTRGRKAAAVTKQTERIRRSDVTAALDHEGARLISLVRRLGEERASQRAVGDWSPRDVVAHCIYWQGMLARMMGAQLMPPTWIPRW